MPADAPPTEETNVTDKTLDLKAGRPEPRPDTRVNFWLEQNGSSGITLMAQAEGGASQNVINVEVIKGRAELTIRKIACLRLCEAMGIERGSIPILALKDDFGEGATGERWRVDNAVLETATIPGLPGEEEVG